MCWPANTWRSTPDNSQAPIVLHNIPVYRSEQPSVDISELSSPQPGFSNLPAFLLLLTLLLHLRGCRRTCGSPHVPQMAEICQAARRLLREEIRRCSSSKAFPTWCHGILAKQRPSSSQHNNLCFLGTKAEQPGAAMQELTHSSCV